MNRNHKDENNFLSPELEAAVESIAALDAPDEAVNRVAGGALQLAVRADQLIEQKTGRQTSLSERRAKRNGPGKWKWAAAAAAVAVALFCVNVFSPATSSAFAQMQQALENVRTIQFVTKITNEETGEELDSIRAFVEQPNHVRQEFSSGSVQVLNLNTKEGMVLDDLKKTCTLFPIYESDSTDKFALRAFEMLRGKLQEPKLIEEKMINGRQVVVYEVSEDFGNCIVSIDKETSMPIQILMDQLAGDPFLAVCNDFVFDEGIDARLFEIATPEGFELVQIQRRDEVVVDEALVFRPEFGLGDAKFGMLRNEVIAALGEPDFISDATQGVLVIEEGESAFEVATLNYNSRGFEVVVDVERGLTNAFFFGVTGFGGPREFEGQFGGGIKMGSSRQEVLDFYGQPNGDEGNVKGGDSDRLLYKADNGASTRFEFRNNKLVAVFCNIPRGDKEQGNSHDNDGDDHD